MGASIRAKQPTIAENVAIQQTQHWIAKVVADLNLCPFAAREIKAGSILYKASSAIGVAEIARLSLQLCKDLTLQPSISTAFLILTTGFSSFSAYLSMVKIVEEKMRKKGYAGVFQMATFHPQYVFHQSEFEDGANYTNRSPFPMLHLLREEMLSASLANFPDPKAIPLRNIQLTRSLGTAHMEALLAQCRK